MNEIEVSLSQTINEIGVNITHGDTPPYYVEKIINNKQLYSGSKFIDLTGVEILSSAVLMCAYQYSSVSGDIDMSSVKVADSQSCYRILQYSDGITSVDLSNLESVFQSAFYQAFGACSNLKSVNLKKLAIMTVNSGDCFTGAFQSTALETINFESLADIEYASRSGFINTFSNCLLLKTAYFPVLSIIKARFANVAVQSTFGGCKALEGVYFGGVKSTTFENQVNQLSFLFDNTTGQNAENGCTVHFPSNFDPENPNKTFDITTLDGYPTFNGNASYIHLAYDLPATE